MNKVIMNKDIMCIKVMRNTQEFVLRNNLYYSDVMPDKGKLTNIRTIFILGEANNKGIPLIAICSAKIRKCQSINKNFRDLDKGSIWQYEWELSNVEKVKDISDLRNHINNQEDQDLVKTCQKITYIESSNLTESLQKRQNSIRKSIIVSDNSIANRVTQEVAPKIEQLQVVHKKGDSINIRDKFGNTSTGTIIDIVNELKQNIIIDQKLTVKIGDKVRQYKASIVNSYN